MSRFHPTRIGAIAVWTGAAVAWGATLVSGVLQPSPPAQSSTPFDRPVVAVDSDPRVSIPSLPANGIVIIRSSTDPAPVAVATARAAPPTTAPPVTTTAPRPQSSGS
ncbi:MAG: hypothetical protein WAL25_10330 [Acidimicrobiia bacterium]